MKEKKIKTEIGRKIERKTVETETETKIKRNRDRERLWFGVKKRRRGEEKKYILDYFSIIFGNLEAEYFSIV